MDDMDDMDDVDNMDDMDDICVKFIAQESPKRESKTIKKCNRPLEYNI